MRHGQPVTADTRMCLMLPPYLAMAYHSRRRCCRPTCQTGVAAQFTSVVLKS